MKFLFHSSSRLLQAVLLVAILAGCSSGSAGGSTGGNTTSDVADNLGSINQGFTPESLESDTDSPTGLMKRAEQGEDPCAESDDLYDCQPVLLRLYLDMAQSFVDMTKDIIGEVGTGLGEVADGSQGTETLDGRTIHYSKESATFFSLLMEGAGPVAYFDVADTVYTLQMDLDNLEEAGEASGKLEIVVDYESETSWSIVIFILGMDCDSSDPRAPERIHIRVSRSENFWTGKAMFYNGRWLAQTASCSTGESDENSMNFYTDFVASDTAAKASVYLLSRTQSDLSDIEDFGMDQFPLNFSGQQDETSAYQNPFCNPASTLDAVWDDDCSSIDSSVGSADFGPATDWIAPSEFYQETITLPSTLE